MRGGKKGIPVHGLVQAGAPPRVGPVLLLAAEHPERVLRPDDQSPSSRGMRLRVHLLTVGRVKSPRIEKKERRMRTPTIAALAAACAVAVSAAPAEASSIVYTKDSNVWITTPDGSYQKAVTTDGTADNRYQGVGQLDDGTIVAGRPSPRFFYALRQDGSLRNAPLLAPGNSCGTGPLDLDVTPTGLIVFQYVHSDFCFNPTPGNGPRSRVTFAFSDVPTGSATFPKHDNWTA